MNTFTQQLGGRGRQISYCKFSLSTGEVKDSQDCYTEKLCLEKPKKKKNAHNPILWRCFLNCDSLFLLLFLFFLLLSDDPSLCQVDLILSNKQNSNPTVLSLSIATEKASSSRKFQVILFEHVSPSRSSFSYMNLCSLKLTELKETKSKEAGDVGNCPARHEALDPLHHHTV